MNRRITRYAPPTLTILLLLILCTARAPAQTDAIPADSALPADTAHSVPVAVAPPTGVSASDVPNDRGGHVIVRWEPSISDENGRVDGYQVLRSESAAGPFDTVGNVAGGNLEFDDGAARRGQEYYYRVVALPLGGGLGSPSDLAGPVRSSAQWFHTGRIPLLIAVILLGGSVLWYIERAKAGDHLYIRKIAGLDAVDEAVGRATEMGRKIYYVPGIQDMNNVQTIAGTTILGRVAQLTAEYDADLQVPTSKSMVMITCREVVKEAHLNAGRPDSYREDNIYYLTDDQFGYAAAVDGMVVREKPATIFYMGAFYAESLILAETGNSIGAI